MAWQTVRPAVRDPRQPTQHSLAAIRIAGQTIELSLTVWLDGGGGWRGRLTFVDGDDKRRVRRTAEIFCGMSEAELWMAVRQLRDHHLRDLYRSLDCTDP